MHAQVTALVRRMSYRGQRHKNAVHKTPTCKPIQLYKSVCKACFVETPLLLKTAIHGIEKLMA